ncbi:hypothetical protein CSUI_003840, partial [Cystoisospora suis]
MLGDPSPWPSPSRPTADTRAAASSLPALYPIFPPSPEPLPCSLSPITSSSFPDVFPLPDSAGALATSARQKLQELKRLELDQRQQQLRHQLLFLGEQQQQAENHLHEEENDARIGNSASVGEVDFPSSGGAAGTVSYSDGALKLPGAPLSVEHWNGETKTLRDSPVTVPQDELLGLALPLGAARSPRGERSTDATLSKTLVQETREEKGAPADRSEAHPCLSLSTDSLVLSQLCDSTALLRSSLSSLPQSHPRQPLSDQELRIEKDPLSVRPSESVSKGPSRLPTLLQCEWGSFSPLEASVTPAPVLASAAQHRGDGKVSRGRIASPVNVKAHVFEELSSIRRCARDGKEKLVSPQARPTSVRGNSAATGSGTTASSVVLEISA